MKKFQLHWRHSKPSIVEGLDIVDAMNKAGIGQGALRALDYWEEISKTESPELLGEAVSIKGKTKP